MDFEWNDRKAKLNIRNHRVSFIEATEVFDDELSSCVADPDHSFGEERLLIFGQTLSNKYLVVSFTERADIIRIISARCMTAHEQQAYEN